MDQPEVVGFRSYLTQWSEQLKLLLQNQSLSESTFISFARDRGLDVYAAVGGIPGELYSRGWLCADGIDHDRRPRFHPFRIYPLHKILEAGRSLMVTPERVSSEPKLEETLSKQSPSWNNIVELAILLEPVYWPRVRGGLISVGHGLSADSREGLLEDYRRNVFDLVKNLDSLTWREIHSWLRRDAAWMDDNPELYMLLRLGSWERREKLKGRIAGALWIRHIAEVIRRAFEDVNVEQWPEEYEAFALWHSAARRRLFGSDRPLDDPLRSKPHIAYTFGLFTGTAVRCYVEGDTELGAILEVLGDKPSSFGIDIQNLYGKIEAGRDNAALKLQDWLTQDKEQRRFSVIFFDGDLKVSRRAISKQAEMDNIVGSVACHEPDFEFANFTLQELIEVAAGIGGQRVRDADWAGVCTGKHFEAKYKSITLASKLKSGQWGRRLAEYALQYPRRSDTGAERPFLQHIAAAMHAWMTNYEVQKERFRIDPLTFQTKLREASPLSGEK